MLIPQIHLRVLFFVTILLLFLPGPFNLNTLQAQNENEIQKPGQMELEIKQASWNGNPVKFDTLQTYQLQKGENFIIVYQNEKVAYLVQLIYKRTGSKITLSQRLVIEMPNGDRHYGKMTKNQHETKDSKKPMKGELNETVTYDRKTMSTCHVEFIYVFH